MEKKDVILAEKDFKTIIKAFGTVSSELLRHSAFFTEMLKNGSISDSQPERMKEFIKATDLIQKIVSSCVIALGKSAGCDLEVVDVFLNSILAKYQFESSKEKMAMQVRLAAYFIHILNDKEKPAERTNKDFAIEVKPNGIKN